MIPDPQPPSGVGSNVSWSPQITHSSSLRFCLSWAATIIVAASAWTSCSLVHQDPANQSPIVQIREADTTVVARGGRVELTVSASDEDDDPLRYEWGSFGAGSFQDSLANSTFWIAPDQIASSSEFFLITVTIIDNQPDTEDPVETFLIEVVQRVPVLVAPADTVISFRDPGIVLEARATDEDNDALSFEWEILEGGLSVDQVVREQQTRGGVSTLRLLPLTPGQIPLAVMTTDGSDTLRREFTVTITATEQPEGGMVALQLPRDDGVSIPYEIDVYEYPNQLGVDPLIVDDWFEASALCREQGKRLCSSLEWTYACRGPEANPYSSVDDPESLPEQYGLRFCNGVGSGLASERPGFDEVVPSGSFPNCSSSTGVYDMTGNAFEWLSDLDPFFGRQATASLSGTAIPGSCGSIDTRQPSVPFADEMDDGDRAAVDALLVQTNFQGYASDRGFRCCR